MDGTTSHDDLVPAAELAARFNRPNPNDSPDYRKARIDLLAAEIALRRQIEAVARMRRALPPGGVVPEDYVLTGEDGQPIRLSQMFGDSDTLVTYFWMYGPKRQRPCPMCTSMLTALDGEARDIARQVPLAIIGSSPIERQVAFKQERGWRHLRLFSSAGSRFARDYHGEGPDGEDWAAFNVFRKGADGTIRLFWADEMGDGTQDPGQDPRGAPEIMPLWTILDMTPHGRAPDWYPSLDYPKG
ncbi:DUF899 family protein [Zavarzinia sp. CC-PAN008]|uniref:DUF899 family protein n=1 Tax=Zavarzinia sp. CC-PAN008 TaxID=3243332 RepID=UPI003F743568